MYVKSLITLQHPRSPLRVLLLLFFFTRIDNNRIYAADTLAPQSLFVITHCGDGPVRVCSPLVRSTINNRTAVPLNL